MATAPRRHVEAEVERLDVFAYTIPVDADEPESDGTLAWDSTTIVVVEAHGGGRTGLGYTYADVSAAALVESLLADEVRGADALAPAAAWLRLAGRIRTTGRPGLGFMALSAVDVALWDLKARLLELPLAAVLNAYRDEVPVYGSGGFTSYPLDRLAAQLAGWVEAGIPRVKMKVSREPARDPERLSVARAAIDRAEQRAELREHRRVLAGRDLEPGRALLAHEPQPFGVRRADRLLEPRDVPTASRRTSRAAAGSRPCCRCPHSPEHTASTCRLTVRRRSPPTRSARWSACVTSSTSTTTCASSASSSTARSRRRAACFARIESARGSGWSSSARDAEAYRA